MPELPEVETTVADLSKVAVGRKIADIWTDTPKRFSVLSRDGGVVVGGRIKAVSRRGKNIIIDLSDGKKILIHQKISGHLLFGKWSFDGERWVSKKDSLQEKVNSYLRFIFTLDNGKMIGLSDPRKFAKVEIWDGEDLDRKLSVEIGPDAMEIDKEEFRERVSNKGSIIKTVLMDQSVISGIGNIYSDEMLWDARISPYRRPKELSDKEMGALFRSMRKVLLKGIKLKGDSMSDYRLIDGTKGGYQNRHKVYKKEGESCPREDGGTIERRKLGSRSLRFCPACQI